MDHRNRGLSNSFEFCYGIWDFWGFFGNMYFLGFFSGGAYRIFLSYIPLGRNRKAESPYYTLLYTLNDGGGQNIWTLTLQPELEEPDLQPKLQPELIQRTFSDSSNGTKCSRVSR